MTWGHRSVPELLVARGSRLAPDLAARLRTLLDASFASATGVRYVDGVVAGLFDLDVRDDAQFLVRRQNGRLLAFLTFVLQPGTCGCHVRLLAVLPGHQCAGHGAALLAALRDRLPPGAVIYGDVRHDNLRARAFYRCLGFAETPQPNADMRATHVHLAATAAQLRVAAWSDAGA